MENAVPESPDVLESSRRRRTGSPRAGHAWKYLRTYAVKHCFVLAVQKAGPKPETHFLHNPRLRNRTISLFQEFVCGYDIPFPVRLKPLRHLSQPIHVLAAGCNGFIESVSQNDLKNSQWRIEIFADLRVPLIPSKNHFIGLIRALSVRLKTRNRESPFDKREILRFTFR